MEEYFKQLQLICDVYNYTYRIIYDKFHPYLIEVQTKRGVQEGESGQIIIAQYGDDLEQVVIDVLKKIPVNLAEHLRDVCHKNDYFFRIEYGLSNGSSSNYYTCEVRKINRPFIEAPTDGELGEVLASANGLTINDLIYNILIKLPYQNEQ